MSGIPTCFYIGCIPLLSKCSWKAVTRLVQLLKFLLYHHPTCHPAGVMDFFAVLGGGMFIPMNIHLGVSKNRGTTKWMVYNGKPY